MQVWARVGPKNRYNTFQEGFLGQLEHDKWQGAAHQKFESLHNERGLLM
jgi:hypothetical protein